MLNAEDMGKLFGVTRNSIYVWKKDGIPPRSRYAILVYNEIMDELDEKGVEGFLKDNFKDKAVGYRHPKRCKAVIETRNTAKRCRLRGVTEEGLCFKHAEEAQKKAFLLSDGELQNYDDRDRAVLPVRCKGYSYGGRFCMEYTYRENGYCKIHQGQVS